MCKAIGTRMFLSGILAMVTISFGGVSRCAGDEAGPVTFEIREIIVEGNTLLHDELLLKEAQPFIGKGKTAQDVEKARTAIEKYYHKKGYPTTLVNIPEQTVEGGVIYLEVIETRIRRVKVSGNRYFTREGLLREMPAFRPGEILYLPQVKEQLARVNRNPDLKVAPILKPGKKLGTIDVEFRVKDKLPLHGELEYNNRTTHTTTDTRLNGVIRYDNLWQKEHGVMVQYQTSPEDTDEVELFIGSYSLPSPINTDHLLSFYGVWSDSETATAGDITVVGEGEVFGVRYRMPLPSYESYIHELTLGLDYKNFEDTLQFGAEADDTTTPVRYLPVSALYTGVIPDDYGQTGISLGLDFNLRRGSSDVSKFKNKRARSKGNYLILAADLQRDLQLPAGMRLWLQGDYQWADQALISNEQYIAGGVTNVRGYNENEAAGDRAWHVTAELMAPDLGQKAGLGAWLECVPYVFYDVASVELIDALPGEDSHQRLSGAGVGMRGYFLKMFEYQLDWAVALERGPTTRIQSGAGDRDDTIRAGDDEFHFIVKFKF